MKKNIHLKNYTNFVKNFLKENKIYFYISFFIFFLFLIISFFIPVDEKSKQIIIKILIKQVGSINNSNSWILFKEIFFNNLFVSFIILISGFFLSFLGIFILFANIFSTLILSSIILQKIPGYKLLLSLLPHGIFEITAILLTLGLALKISWILIKKVWNWKDNFVLPYLKNIFKFWLIFIVPLLLFAAFVESFITPLFLNNKSNNQKSYKNYESNKFIPKIQAHKQEIN